MVVSTFLAIKYFLVKVHTSLFYCSFNRLQYGINFYMCFETTNVWLALLWWSRTQLQYLWGVPANAGNKRHSKHERPASSQMAQWWRICLPMQDLDLIPRLGRSLGVRNGNPLRYSCLENPTYRGAWRATVFGVAKSQIQLSDWTHTYTHTSLRNTPIPILLHLPQHEENDVYTWFKPWNLPQSSKATFLKYPVILTFYSHKLAFSQNNRD